MNPNNYDLQTQEGLENSKRWLSLALTKLSDNGIWGIPRSGTVVRIDKQSKTATIISQHLPDPSIELVFKAIGWSVVELNGDSTH